MVCDCCGLPLPGAAEPEETILCDDCLGADRAWSRGRAALVYRDNARKIVLGIKHGDRHDLVRPAAAWLAQALTPILRDDMLVTCVPLHWRRLLRRRYNQAALLSGALARRLGLEHCPDLLHRPAATRMLDGLGRAERAAHLAGAIVPHRRRGARMAGRSVLIIDDVMTSGATLDAAAMACRAAGAVDVRVGVLARVALEV
jgi:predicted amidophosphoribosyltransferase